MPGTSEGAKKTRETIKKRYGENFYSQIGRIGGSRSTTGGFKDKELARRAGRKGGKASKRKKVQEVQ